MHPNLNTLPQKPLKNTTFFTTADQLFQNHLIFKNGIWPAEFPMLLAIHFFCLQKMTKPFKPVKEKETLKFFGPNKKLKKNKVDTTSLPHSLSRQCVAAPCIPAKCDAAW